MRATSKNTTSRSAYYANFHKATLGAQQQLSDFRRDWLGEGTQEILHKAEKRRETDGNMATAASVQKYGWIENGKANGKEKGGTNGEKTVEDMGKVLESWKEKHSDAISAEFLEEKQKIMVQSLLHGLKYTADSMRRYRSQQNRSNLSSRSRELRTTMAIIHIELPALLRSLHFPQLSDV